MAQGILIWGLLIALVGVILALVFDILLDILGDTHHSHNKRQESALLEHRHRHKPHDAHPGSQRFRPDNET